MCVTGENQQQQKGNCKSIADYKDDEYASVSGGGDTARTKLEDDLFDNKIKPACDDQNKPNKPDFRTLQLCIDPNTCGASEYTASAWSKNCNDATKDELWSGGNALTASLVNAPGEGGPAAYYQYIKLAARFTDQSPVHQVDPTAPNRFCAYISQSHVCENTDPVTGFKKVGSCS